MKLVSIQTNHTTKLTTTHMNEVASIQTKHTTKSMTTHMNEVGPDLNKANSEFDNHSYK